MKLYKKRRKKGLLEVLDMWKKCKYFVTNGGSYPFCWKMEIF